MMHLSRGVACHLLILLTVLFLAKGTIMMLVIQAQNVCIHSEVKSPLFDSGSKISLLRVCCYLMLEQDIPLQRMILPITWNGKLVLSEA